MVVNDFYQKKAQIHFESSSLDISPSELLLILADIRSFLNKNLDEESKTLDIYKKPNKFTNSLAFINLGLSLQEEREDGMLVISEKSDVLSYGKEKHNFVHSVDRVSISNWGEVITHKNHGSDSLFTFLTEIINSHRQPITATCLEIFCYSPIRAASITTRIKHIFSTLVRLFSESSGNYSPRYIVPGGPSYFVFQREDNRLIYNTIADNESLKTELSKPQKTYSPVFLDDEVLKENPISYIYPLNRPQIIQIFYETKGSSGDIYILDEKGSLFQQHHEDTIPSQILTAYTVFLEKLLIRGMLEHSLNIEYYEIFKNSKGFLSCSRIEHKPTPVSQYFDLRITGKEINPDQIIYTIFCNETEFSTMDQGDQVFKAAAEFIFQHRQGNNNYPIHITDIDVPLPVLGIACIEELQSIHFLQYKKKIEDRLNH